jgi:hypothetical protein
MLFTANAHSLWHRVYAEQRHSELSSSSTFCIHDFVSTEEDYIICIDRVPAELAEDNSFVSRIERHFVGTPLFNIKIAADSVLL